MPNVQLPILNCDHCGACCHLQPAPPYMPTELDVLPRHLLAELQAARPGDGKGPCFWLTSENRCRHYEHRPEVCRQFELGGEDCLAVREEFFSRPSKQRKQ